MILVALHTGLRMGELMAQQMGRCRVLLRQSRHQAEQMEGPDCDTQEWAVPKGTAQLDGARGAESPQAHFSERDKLRPHDGHTVVLKKKT
ncbi:MAG: hypothetical protein V3T05_04155 [Myxococcota bacterium]